VTTPSRQDRLRPLEFVVISVIVAVFIGLVVLFTTRQPILAVIFFGVAFIVSLVVIAMLSLAIKPNEAEQTDITEQDDAGDSRPSGH
jgi:undecaprenyl pyrophosphate phosphatase UppP